MIDMDKIWYIASNHNWEITEVDAPYNHCNFWTALGPISKNQIYTMTLRCDSLEAMVAHLMQIVQNYNPDIYAEELLKERSRDENNLTINEMSRCAIELKENLNMLLDAFREELGQHEMKAYEVVVENKTRYVLHIKEYDEEAASNIAQQIAPNKKFASSEWNAISVREIGGNNIDFDNE